MKKKADPTHNKKGEKRPENPYVNHESMAYYKMKEAYSSSMSAEKKEKSRPKFSFGKKTAKKEGEARSKPEPRKIIPLKEPPKSALKKKDTKVSKEKKVAEKQKKKSLSAPVEIKKKEARKTVSIVEKKTKKRSFLRDTGITVLIVAILCIIFSFSVVLVDRYSKIAQIKYQINVLNKELSEKQREIDDLKVQLESQNRSDIIEKYAREELGMEYPKESKITYIRVN